MLSIIRKPYFENYMIPAYQHIVRSHIGSERVNAEPTHLLPPPAASGLEARSTLYLLTTTTAAPPSPPHPTPPPAL